MPKFRIGKNSVIESDFAFGYDWIDGKAEISENGSKWGNTFDGWTCIYLPAHIELWVFLINNKTKEGMIIEQIGNEFKILDNA